MTVDSISATQASQPAQAIKKSENAASQKQSDIRESNKAGEKKEAAMREERVNKAQLEQTKELKATVNTSGQTIGTRINIAA